MTHFEKGSRRVASLLFAGSVAIPARVDAQPPAGSQRAFVPSIPLCPGLTIVTAISQKDGDYESIKTIESISDGTVRLTYSSERMVNDIFSNEGPKLEKLSLRRAIRLEDLRSAPVYLQQFYSELPETIPGTTAIGTSTAVLRALKTRGEAELGIFNAFNGQPSLDRNTHPNVYDFQMMAPIRRIGTAPVMLPVLVNDARVELPAIHARGDFFGDTNEFFFHDDPANPIALKFRLGVGAVGRMSEEERRARGIEPKPDGGEKDLLQVIKISTRCTGTPPQTGAGAGAGQPLSARDALPSAIEHALTTGGKADVYDVYFSFNSDTIRQESEPVLQEIAGILQRHPDWTLRLNGHTDNVASDAYNLELSRRRAAAVKAALVGRYRVDARRLTTSGFGESQPKDTNATLEGRAQNRRVELVRQ